MRCAQLDPPSLPPQGGSTSPARPPGPFVSLPAPSFRLQVPPCLWVWLPGQGGGRVSSCCAARCFLFPPQPPPGEQERALSAACPPANRVGLSGLGVRLTRGARGRGLGTSTQSQQEGHRSVAVARLALVAGAVEPSSNPLRLRVPYLSLALHIPVTARPIRGRSRPHGSRLRVRQGTGARPVARPPAG